MTDQNGKDAEKENATKSNAMPTFKAERKPGFLSYKTMEIQRMNHGIRIAGRDEGNGNDVSGWTVRERK